MSSNAPAVNLTAYDGSGTAAVPTALGYVTLTVDSHYFEVPLADADIVAVQIVTDATIAGVFTVEDSNYPNDGTAGAATAYNEVSGVWVLENNSGAYIATVGTGWTVAAATLTKTAGVGGAMVHLSDSGSRRVRIKAAITTGGTVRILAHSKGY